MLAEQALSAREQRSTEGVCVRQTQGEEYKRGYGRGASGMGKVANDNYFYRQLMAKILAKPQLSNGYESCAARN